MKIFGYTKRNWRFFVTGFVLAMLIVGGCCTAVAGVPVKFTVETSRADVQEVQCYHGETLDFDVAFKNYGKDLYFPTNAEAQIFWQTNGMSAFYWRTNNVNVVSNHMMATFTPEMDPGSGTVFGFIGIPGDIYRASFVLRLKQSPGWKVREMEWPYRELDFSKVEMKNVPFYFKSESDELLIDTVKSATNKLYEVLHGEIEVATPGDYYNVSNKAYTALQSYTETDPTIPGWAKQANPPIDTTLTQSGKAADAKVTGDAFAGRVPWANSTHNAVTIGTRSGGLTIGQYSLVNGVDCSATNYASHAEGHYTKANGEYSHAEGYNNVAQGYYSHAEGNNTKTSGGYSHAEGRETNAYGYYAHAEGYYAYANGDYSHAEGMGSHADGERSHAEGYYTYANGFESHAEGELSRANGSCSHAEGSSTYAIGDCSHAEGDQTEAWGSYSHAEGFHAYAWGDHSHAEGVGARTGVDQSHGHKYAYAWQGIDNAGYYNSHGNGTYNINPVGGLSGFWVGETNMFNHIRNLASTPGDYETVSNRAMNAIQYGEVEPPGNYTTVSNRAMNAVQMVDDAAQNLRYTITADDGHFYFSPVSAIDPTED